MFRFQSFRSISARGTTRAYLSASAKERNVSAMRAMSWFRSRFLFAAFLEAAGRVDEQHPVVARVGLVAVQHQDRRGDAGAVEEVRRETDEPPRRS